MEKISDETTMIRFIDLFSGIGGFRLGLEKNNSNRGKTFSENNIRYKGDKPNCEGGAWGCCEDSEHREEDGKHTESWLGNKEGGHSKYPEISRTTEGSPSYSRDFKCVWSNDIDKYANQVYQYQFGTENHFSSDIRQFFAEQIPNHDLLCGGFPCQSFSLAGKRKGFEDTRGSLFFEIARILEAKRPRYFLLENVKGLLSNENGKTFQRILGILANLGYSTEWCILNSKNFGVPQNRERVFFIGHLGGECTREIFPLQKDGSKADENRAVIRTIQGGAHSGGLHSQMTGIEIKQLNQPKHSYHRVYGVNGLCPSQRSHSGNKAPKIECVYLSHAEEGRWGNRIREEYGTLGTSNDIGILEERRIRRLTPIECERLQGFPDNWTKWGIDEKSNKIEISDTQRYKMLGNAVTVNVIEYIASLFIKNI